MLVAGKDGRLAERRIRTGLSNWEFTEVQDGLDAGERVVTSLERTGVKVDMTQIYRDSSGKGDKGVKTLLLHPKGDSWVIASETWSALTP